MFKKIFFTKNTIEFLKNFIVTINKIASIDHFYKTDEEFIFQNSIVGIPVQNPIKGRKQSPENHTSA